MNILIRSCLLLITCSAIQLCYSEDIAANVNIEYKWPTIGITVLIRNKGFSLPYFLTLLGAQEYPKDRLYLWIYSDYNEDNSADIVKAWTTKYGPEYNNLYVTVNTSTGQRQPDQKYTPEWTPLRFKHMINLREKAIEFARKMWADYIFMLDADVFLSDPKTLKNLVVKDLPVVAPMLLSDGLYSNFWGGMTESYYYKRTDNYEKMISREEIGCFPVPMVHSAVLISLRTIDSDLLTYDPKKIKNYDGPEDDIIAFAINAQKNNIETTVCNDKIYGFISIPMQENDDLVADYEQVRNVHLEALSRGVIFPLDPSVEKFIILPKKAKLGLSEVYVINLERRVERRVLMQKSLDLLGIDVNFVKAVDGKNIDLNDLKKVSVTLMPGYEDPYHKRPMKTGEIGCFLSHYKIWQEIAKKNYAITLILEDDIHFTPYFNARFRRLMDEVRDKDWDLLYIGRKILQDGKEEYFTDHTTIPLYSYWTLGYVIKESGARKLINAEPLTKMLPVDEFLPIMFDQHPNNTWKSYFPVRNLKALSAAPLLIHPTHYTGQEGYISDTEDSHILDTDTDTKPKNVRTDL